MLDEDLLPQNTRPRSKVRRGWALANQVLQDSEEYQDISFTPNNWFSGVIIDEETGKPMEYIQIIKNEKHRIVWSRSFANELGRLVQRIIDVKGTSTIKSISRIQVPEGRTVTYGRIVVDFWPHKQEPERTWLAVGRDRIYNPPDVRTPIADITTSKLLINSTLSTQGAKFFSIDVKNFYLNTLLYCFEYMRLHLDIIPEEIIESYNLQSLATNG